LQEGQATAALALVSEHRQRGVLSTELQLIEVRALHRLERHEDEWRSLSEVPLEGLDKAKADLIEGLLQDFGADDHGLAIREQLDRLAVRHAGAIRSVVKGPYSRMQWGAVRYADVSKLPGAELVPGYIAALQSPECREKGIAADRLGALGDASALEPLRALRATPRKPGFLFIQANCGQDEAGWALRELTKER
jgi:hypothetical protein